MEAVIISLFIITVLAFLIVKFKKNIRSWAYGISLKLQLKTLRGAIAAADADKEKTGRKNMVVYNTTTKSFEPMQKKALKHAAKAKVQEEVKKGFRQPKAKKVTPIKSQRVRVIEKKSLYVTQ